MMRKFNLGKRIASMFLAFTLMISSFSVAFAEEATDDAVDVENTDEITNEEEEYTVIQKDRDTGEEKEITFKVNKDVVVEDCEPYIPDNPSTFAVIGSDDRHNTSSNHEKYRQVCFISTRQGWGTGFLIGPSTVATSAHVIYDEDKFGGYASDVKVYLESKNQTDTAKIAGYSLMRVNTANPNDIDNGWAIIELDKPLGEYYGYFGYINYCYEGQFAALTGFHKDRDLLSTSEGSITSINGNTLWHDCDAVNGASGSPVYTPSYHVMGIHWGENKTLGTNFATKVSTKAANQFASSRRQYYLSEQGYLDTITTSKITGWALNPDKKYDTQRVDIYVYDSNGKVHDSAPIKADIFRNDVGLHGFEYNISWLKYQPGEYNIYAYTIGVWGGNPLLKNSPKSYNVRQSTGTVDYVNSSGVGGWVWKPDAPDDAIEAHIYFYDADTGRLLYGKPVKANTYRSDLKASGRGNGCHGFSLAVDWKQWGAKRIRVDTYSVDGSGYNPQVSSKIYTVQ